MIEDCSTGIPHWWTGSEWTTTAQLGKQFDNIVDASVYLSTQKRLFTSDANVQITEHIFMSPVSVPENLN